jgi:hypothetical protein
VLKQKARDWLEWVQLPERARHALRRDHAGLLFPDPGPERVIEAGIKWLSFAQDCSASRDGGVARHYSLLDAWSASYPETTGYIAATMISYGLENKERESIERARRMLDWLVAIQFPEGGFQGGMVGQIPRVPVTFNTGQILIGLCAGAEIDDHFTSAARKAADWLVETQDEDGCWRKYATPFANPGVKTYETHVSLALFRAARLMDSERYADAGTKQVDWALREQRENGWLSNCCLGDSDNPLTHTLGYALRGILEAYLYSRENRFLDAASRAADGMMAALPLSGALPGRLGSDWRPAVDWVCLTGASQLAECWLILNRITGRPDYRDAALRANAFVRRTIDLAGPSEIRGAVKGAYPVDGDYGRWQYLNWACKFTIDANRAELAMKRRSVAAADG